MHIYLLTVRYTISYINQRADQMEFIKEFQEVMNQAIEQLLKRSARRHPCRKDKPEPCTEQGKHKENHMQGSRNASTKKHQQRV